MTARRVLPIIAVVLVAVAVIGLRPRQAAPRQEAATSTATVTRTDLVETHTVDGEIGFGPSTPLPAILSGTLTRVPAVGATIGRGQQLYGIDARPVVLMLGALPAYRELRPGLRGRDVRQLERNLTALGYDGFTTDDRFTAATARAVRAWQDDRGLPETGTVELGRVVFWPRAIRIDTVELAPGQPVSHGAVVLAHTATGRSVYADVEVSLAGFARRGATVQVRLPDRPPLSGVISAVGTAIEAGSASQQGGEQSDPQGGQEARVQDPTIAVTVSLGSQSSLGPISGAPAEVRLTGNRRSGVLAVPVAALLALREGGHGLEIVDGSGRRLVAVRTGLFAAGRVEVSGPGVMAGTVVGMAAG